MKAGNADWIAPVTAALQDLKTPRRLFFRDDDAGWADQKLYQLLDIFAQASTPVDLAVIPACLTKELTYALQARYASQVLGLHQHGFQHASHALSGRKCEFGGDRTLQQQFADIKKGRNHLTRAFGNLFDPIFTPPWNRCSSMTIDCLVELDFQALSRDQSAEALDPQTLTEIPIDIDWCRFDAPSQLAHAIAKAISHKHRVGIMLHHAIMPSNSLRALQDLLRLLSRDTQIQCCPMRDLLAQKINEREMPACTSNC